MVNGWNWDSLDVIPRHPGTGKEAEQVVPVGDLGGIFSRHPFAADIMNRLDGRVLSDERAYHQGSPTHHQTNVGSVWRRVPAADFQPPRPLVGEGEIHGIVDTEIQFSGVDKREKGRGPRVGLNYHLDRRRSAHYLG